MSTLLDSFKSYVTPELIGQAAAMYGETESGITKVIHGVAPTILAGLLGKAQNSGVMNTAFNQISKFDSGILGNLASLFNTGNLAQNDPKDASGQLLGLLFGAKVPAITNSISAFAGVKSATTSSLLGFVGPLLMGVLSKKISTDGLNVAGLNNLILSERNSILGTLPSGLSSIIGLSNLSGPTSGDTGSSAGGMRWLLPLLLLLALGGGIMYYLKNCTAVPEPVVVAPPPAPAPAPVPAPAPKLSLPAGTQEAALLAFVRDTAAHIDKAKWFDFPEIMFDVAKSDIKPESEAKLNAVLSVLKEYPAVKLKVGGYTDTDGNDKANLKLSDDRAKACQAWLIAKGVAADRLEAEGYGEANPVAPNDTPENKAKNRRISFSVRAK